MHALAPKVPTAGPVHTRIRPRFRFVAAVLLFPFVAAVSNSQAQTSSPTGGAWTPIDIGAPVVAGNAAESACAAATGCPLFTISAAGAGVGGTADQFTFLYQKLSGDGSVTVRLQSLSGSSAVEAGVMMRESLTPTAMSTSLLLGSSDAALRSRLTAAGTTSSTAVLRAGWLRLERTGPKVTASVSNDGSMWTVAAVQSISLPPSIYVGIAVASRAATSPATASVSNMSIVSTTPTLPSGWTSADVGSALSPGSASYANGSFLASGSGSGFAAASDAFRFVYTRIRGDGKLSTRMAASQGATGWQGGIVLRSTLDPGADEVALVADPDGLWLVKRAATAQSAAKTRVATTTLPVMLQLDRQGSMVTASYSIDGATWVPVSTSAVTFGGELYAGLAVASGVTAVSPTANPGANPGSTTAGAPAAAAAAFDRVSLVSIAANVPPAVSLDSPANGETFVQGAPVAIAAAASDPDDLVAGVEFRVNGATVATDSVAPYAASWTPAAPGTYAVVAVASDFDGAVTTSSPSVITVIASASGSPNPSGDATSPTSGGSNPTPPPSSSTAPPPAPVTAPVPAAPAPDPVPVASWRLEFGASADHASLDHYELEVYLYGGDSIRSVDIGKPTVDGSGNCSVDINWVVTALPTGQYSAVVRAVSYGGSTGSAPYSFIR